MKEAIILCVVALLGYLVLRALMKFILFSIRVAITIVLLAAIVVVTNYYIFPKLNLKSLSLPIIDNIICKRR
jgi:hypothetical protein